MKKHLPLLIFIAGTLPLCAQTNSTPNSTSTSNRPAAKSAFLTKLDHDAVGVGPINEGWPGFQNVWESRRAGFAKTKKENMGAVVFLGDSITHAWDLSTGFPTLKTANRGIAGDTTRGMLYRLQEDVINLKPRLIVILGGVNDLSMDNNGGTPEVVAANVRSMLQAIKQKLPHTPVIVNEILPCRYPGVAATNGLVDKVLVDFPNAHRFKSYALFLNPDGSQNLTLFTDALHPNPAGYAIFQPSLQAEINKWTASVKK